MSDSQQNPEPAAGRLDFAPFDPQANLEALCEIIKAIRNMSWSYAGDIDRSVKKIGQMLYAGRCILCVSADDSGILAYEYIEPPAVPVKQYLLSIEGQQVLRTCLEQSSDCVLITDVVSDGKHELHDALRDPSTYIFPLHAQHTRRQLSKPGLLILQEPHGLTRWNKRILDSVVVVSEYLAMVIECERLHAQLETEDLL